MSRTRSTYTAPAGKADCDTVRRRRYHRRVVPPSSRYQLSTTTSCWDPDPKHTVSFWVQLMKIMLQKSHNVMKILSFYARPEILGKTLWFGQHFIIYKSTPLRRCMRYWQRHNTDYGHQTHGNTAPTLTTNFPIWREWNSNHSETFLSASVWNNQTEFQVSNIFVELKTVTLFPVDLFLKSSRRLLAYAFDRCWRLWYWWNGFYATYDLMYLKGMQ